MKKQHTLIYLILLVGVFLVFANSCKKDDNTNNGNNAVIPEVTTTAVTDITQNTAISGGHITSDGGASVTARGVCWSISQTPTISDSITTDGTGSGTFSSNMSGLSPEITYYVRAYATNSAGTAYGSAVSFTTQQDTSSFTDPRDANVYQMITIGNRVWMAENLRYLPSVVGPATGSDTIPCYYVYDYDGTSVNDAKTTSNYTTYGVLYNWPAAMNGNPGSTSNPSGVQGICPPGWHLPSDAEWTELTDYFGGAGVAGGKLKETGTSHWNSPNIGATNLSRFTALPGGLRNTTALFHDLGSYGYWWSATVSTNRGAYYRRLDYISSNVFKNFRDEECGFSVRCIRD